MNSFLQARQVTLRDIHGADIPNLWMETHGTAVPRDGVPAVLVIGSAVELEDRMVPLVPVGILEAQCEQVADILARQGVNLISDACPGIPNIIERKFVTFARRGVALDLSVLRCPDDNETARAYSPSGFPACGDIRLYCASGFELLSIINTYCTDIVLIVGGGLGSLMEGIIAVVNDLPIVCYSPPGGIASEMQPLFERYRSRYKNLRITTCATIKALDDFFAEFVVDFQSRRHSSRFRGFLQRLEPARDELISRIEISVGTELEYVRYSCGQSALEILKPKLLVDDACILNNAMIGSAMRGMLETALREYRYDGLSLFVPSGICKRVWCPSIDTFILIGAMRRRGRQFYDAALDVGTGTGVIGLWLAASGKAGHVLGIDIEPEAARCAAVNATNTDGGCRCRIRKVSYQDFWREGTRFDLVACNPPYVPVLDGEPEENGTFFGMGLAMELLNSIDSILAPGGECFMTLSSVSWTDSGIARRMQILVDNGQAAIVDERVVPFKLTEVLINARWLNQMIDKGGVFLLGEKEAYSYGHRVQVWHLTCNRQTRTPIAALHSLDDESSRHAVIGEAMPPLQGLNTSRR